MSLTPPVINATPKGLLSLLGIKNGGSNPQSLAGFIQPTTELLSFYMNSVADEYGFSAPAAAGFAGALSFTNQTSGPPFPGGPSSPPGAIAAGGVFVPQNEVWVVLRWHVGWASVGPASDWAILDIGLTAAGHEHFPAQSTCDVTPIPATTYSRTRSLTDIPLILFGGSELKLSVQNVATVGGKVFSSAARIARLTL